MTHAITLGGLPLLADEPVTWALTSGVEPYSRDVSCTPDVAAALFLRHGPLTLSIRESGGRVSEWRNLWALHAVPGVDPFRARVRIVDIRWIFPYAIVLRRFNLRRHSGFFRIAANDVLELERTSERLRYVAGTTRPDGQPWTAQQILADVLAVLSRAAQERGAPFDWRFDSEFKGVAQVPVENVEVDEDGASALRRVLSLIPEARCYVDPSGTLVVTSRASAAEQRVLQATAPEIVGGGHITEIDHRNESPREIHVLFTIESELRFDAIEIETTAPVDDTRRRLQNVLPVPDYVLRVGGQSVVQGTWIDFPTYLDAIGAPPGLGVPRLTLQLIRRAFMPFLDLWASILSVGLLDTNADWAARIAALQTHYRRTYRIPRQWMDRILSLRAHRVATVNQATGERAPATAYSDYALVGSQRSQLRDYSQAIARGGVPRIAYAVNVPGYRAEIDSSAKPAPAIVSVLHHDSGVIQLAYQIDPHRVYEQVLPSRIEERGLPGFAPARGSPGAVNITFDSLLAPGAPLPELARDHRVAVILSAIPLAPNDSRQLYRVVVKPDDIARFVPAGVVADAKRARGPIREVRVHPGLETARLRWIDGREEDYERLFGLRDGVPNLAGLCVNASGQPASIDFGANGFSAGQGASLDQISRAIAARIWSSYRTHAGGSRTASLTPAVEPLGWIESAVHSVHPTGEVTTQIALPIERLPELDFATLVDPGTRAILLRHVYTGGPQ